MPISEKTIQSNLSAVERGTKALEEILEFTKNPKAVTEDLLWKIIRDNEDTEYGRKIGFKDIRTLEDFKKKVPLSVFDDYAEYVVRELDGEKNLHSVYGVKQYNRSSGTMGNPKKIPMSEVSMDYHVDFSNALPYGVAAERMGTGFCNGKTLSVCEASSIAYVGDDIRYCGVSAHTVLDWNIARSEIHTSPIEASRPDKGTDSRYLHARYGLAEKDVTCIHTTFMTFVLDLFHYIENNWQMLCDDIESGRIDPSVKMEDSVRAKLESELVPMPERASELRKIFSEGFDRTLGKRIWPGISFLIGVSTGTFAAYLKNLQENYLGDVPVFKTGLMASEGALAAPVVLDSSEFVPMGHTIYYEFLPLDEEDPTKTLGIEELEEGGEYELILTTMSGFYRYRTRDALRVAGKVNGCPTLEYLYRIDMCVNLNGEKTYEPALRKAMDLTSEELGFTYMDFCVYPDTDVTPSLYRFFIEMSKRPEVMDIGKIASVLQKNLIKANPLLEYKFQRDLCGPVKAHILQEETYLLYRDKLIMKGGASTQVKPVKIIMNEAQLRFFRILVDKEAEQ